MSQEVFDANTKPLKLNFVGSNIIYELGCSKWNKKMQNELNDFSRPATDPNDIERRMQNLLRVQEVHNFTCYINDEFVRLSDNNAGATTKEEVEESIDNIFRGRRLIEVKYGHVDITGYMTEYSVEETWQSDGSVFRITFDLLVGTTMSS